MLDFKITPITELSEEVINEMFIHSTRGSIRRASSVKPFVSYPATDEVPAITYVVEEVDSETKEARCSYHVLTSDVTKFLLKKVVPSKEVEGKEENSGVSAEEISVDELPENEVE